MQDPRAEKSWHFDPLIERKAALSGDIAPYQIIEATSKDKEKVVGFYQHCPVPGYDIGNVQVIYNRDFNQGFEIQIKNSTNEIIIPHLHRNGATQITQSIERRPMND